MKIVKKSRKFVRKHAAHIITAGVIAAIHMVLAHVIFSTKDSVASVIAENQKLKAYLGQAALQIKADQQEIAQLSANQRKPAF